MSKTHSSSSREFSDLQPDMDNVISLAKLSSKQMSEWLKESINHSRYLWTVTKSIQNRGTESFGFICTVHTWKALGLIANMMNLLTLTTSKVQAVLQYSCSAVSRLPRELSQIARHEEQSTQPALHQSTKSHGILEQHCSHNMHHEQQHQTSL